MYDFTEEVALIWARQHAGLYAGKPEQFGRAVEAVRRGALGVSTGLADQSVSESVTGGTEQTPLPSDRPVRNSQLPGRSSAGARSACE